MSFQVEIAHYKDIELDNLTHWIDELDSFLKHELSDYVCFIHSHGAFPESEIPAGVTKIARGRGAFLIFGNRNQFFKIDPDISLNKAIDSVGAYGFVKLYFVNRVDDELVTDAIKKKKLGFYSDTEGSDKPFLTSSLNLKRGFIEIETWMECRSDGKGGEWTYLKTFKAEELPALPKVLT